MFASLLSLIFEVCEPLGKFLVEPNSIKESVPTLKEQNKIKYKKICEHCMRE